MSKFTLGQRQFPTSGLRSQQPKNNVDPTLSCYLGYIITSSGFQKIHCVVHKENGLLKTNANYQLVCLLF